MKKKPRAERANALRRRLERGAEKLERDRERLFRLEPGGSPERPLEVASASVVEAHAQGVRCPRCDGQQQVLEHRAISVSGARLREARLVCRNCGTQRSLFFRIRDERAN